MKVEMIIITFAFGKEFRSVYMLYVKKSVGEITAKAIITLLRSENSI